MTFVEPGFVETELQGHNKNPVVIEQVEKKREQIGEVLEAEDIADAIVYAVASRSTSASTRCSSGRPASSR